MTDSDDFPSEVLLSMQRALWDMVTPQLRAVAVNWDNGNIHGRMIYDRVREAERWIVAEVETYVIADFLPEVDVRLEAVELPAWEERDLQPGEHWVFRRKED